MYNLANIKFRESESSKQGPILTKQPNAPSLYPGLPNQEEEAQYPWS